MHHWARACSSSLPLQFSAILWRKGHLLKACGSSCPLLVPRLSLLVSFFVGLSVVAGQQWDPPESRHLAEWWQNCQCLLQKFDLCLGTFVRDRNPNMCHLAGQMHCNISPQKDLPSLLWGGKASQAEKMNFAEQRELEERKSSLSFAAEKGI